MCNCCVAVEPQRPNIVLIITDDQNDYFSAASGVDAHTPALDRLTKQGISFTQAYCASPVCGPSRAALFSGLYPHHTGAYLNGAAPWLNSRVLQATETLPELFQRGGYETWGMGKLYHAKLPAGREDRQWNNKAKANGGFGPFADKNHQLSGKFFSVQEWDGPDRDFPDVKSADAAINFLTNRNSPRLCRLVYPIRTCKHRDCAFKMRPPPRNLLRHFVPKTAETLQLNLWVKTRFLSAPTEV